MELQILHWFESLHNPVLNPIMYALTWMGEYGMIWIALALLCIFAFHKKYRKTGVTMAVALILSVIFCNCIMKNMWHRVRPFNVDTTFENVYGIFGTIFDWSFPSGHTSASFSAATAIFMWDKKKGAIALVLAVLIALSRLYFTVHYPTDVLTSLILGTLYGVVSYFIVNAVRKKSKAINNWIG